MSLSIAASRLAVAALSAAPAGCGSAAPVAYSGLASPAQLAPNPQDDSGRVPYRYATPVDRRRYSRVIVDPVAIYRGPDHQFGDMSEEDKAALASTMQAVFTERLRTRFTQASDAAPNTLRIRLTLTGAATSTPVLHTFTRCDIGGGVINGVQAVSGGEGLFTGSVTYAVEIHDAASNRLLGAFVTGQYPNAYNIGAGFGSLTAARTGIEKGADALLAQLRQSRS